MRKYGALACALILTLSLAPISADAATITCVKGKNVLTVSGKKPICPSGYKVKKVTPTPTPTPTPKKSMPPINGIGIEIPYLEMEVGCYSSTYPVEGPVNISQSFISRTFYTASCTGQYHWQVFFAGQVKTKGNAQVPTEDDITTACFAEYKKVFGKEAPTSIEPGAIYLRWFMPDTSDLGKKYPQRIECIAHTADSGYNNALVNTKPLG